MSNWIQLEDKVFNVDRITTFYWKADRKDVIDAGGTLFVCIDEYKPPWEIDDPTGELYKALWYTVFTKDVTAEDYNESTYSIRRMLKEQEAKNDKAI